MKQIVLTGIKKMEFVEATEPSVNSPDDVKIKLSSIGVCGSDIHYYTEGRIGSQVVKYPFPIGHECSGIVEAIGDNVNNVKVGDLVVVEPSVYCGKCDQCLAGRPHTCRYNRYLGTPGQLDGCLSDYIVMPSYTCYPVSGKMNAVQAALIEPFSIGVYTVKQAGITNSGISTAIFGAGPIGLSVLLTLLAEGVNNNTVIEPLDYRLERAGEIGARYLINPGKEDVESIVSQNEKLLLDVAFEASGEQEAVDNAVKILKPGGKLVLVGIPPVGNYCFDMDLMRRKELTVVNIRRQNGCVQKAIDLVVSGRADVEKMVTHHFGFKETIKAFDIVEGYEDGVIKAIIDLQ
jgi:L-iditol 2-dehydrogenase